MPATKLVQYLTVANNIRLNARHFIIELVAPEKLPLLLPGQFVEVLVENSPATFIRRPFSIYSVDWEKNVIRLLVQERGEGTRKMGLLRRQDKVNLIYPLGKSFSMPEDDQVLLIGGGVGTAPMMFLSQHLHGLGIQPDLLVGARSREDLFEMDLFGSYCNAVYISTEDGSEGEKGLLTEHSVFSKDPLPYKRFYCCGPDPMMHAVAGIAKILGVECEVSLENYMACGFGVCLCCITPTIYGNQRSCMEGPVFNTKVLGW